MQVTIKDIARAAAVSVQTVSNVVNGRPVVREETRARVLAICRELNYTPNAAARSLVTGSRKMIGAVVPHIGNPLYGEVTTFLTRAARALGFSTLVGDTGWEPEAEMTLLRGLIGQGVDGVILASTTVDGAGLRMVQDAGIPVVMLFNYPVPCPADSFRLDNAGAFRAVTRHLIGLGHRRILFLMRPGRRTIERRREGWQDALIQHGIAVTEEMLVPVDDWIPDLAVQAIAQRIRERGLDFTAILAAGDSLAAGAIVGVQQAGYTVPGDVSIMGIDDLPQAAFLTPPLTSMHVPKREIGMVALDLLRDGLSGPPMPARRVELACHLVERLSVGPAPGWAPANLKNRGSGNDRI